VALIVERAGVLTTVQDLGRHGYQHVGVPVSGAMDCYSLRVANALVGNNERDAALEITLDGPALLFEQDMLVALCGADLSAHIGQAAVPMLRPVWANAGSRLQFGPARMGSRAYLAIAGGIELPAVLGSRSTYLRAALGGLSGRALKRGDRLPAGAVAEQRYPKLKAQALESRHGFAAPHWSASVHPERLERSPQILRFMPGRHWEALPAEQRARFTGSDYRVATASDRMGYRLEGGALDFAGRGEMLSEAVAFGTIQLPSDGNPIVLMADRQVTGGYPRVGEIASVDLALAAQLKPGDHLRFEKITLPQAQQLWIAQERAYNELQQAVRGHLSEGAP
jgi:antagonist of KipI